MWTSWWTPATTALVSPCRYPGLIVALKSLLDRHVDVVTLLRQDNHAAHDRRVREPDAGEVFIRGETIERRNW